MKTYVNSLPFGIIFLNDGRTLEEVPFNRGGCTAKMDFLLRNLNELKFTAR
jgi:hypothetical protein